MAEESDKVLKAQIDQLKKEKERLEADKAKLEAEKALLDIEKVKLETEKALAETQKAITEAKDKTAQKLTDLKNQKALLEARKELEEATSVGAKKLSELKNQKTLVETQKELAEMQKALEQASSASGKQTAEVQSQKALLDAQKTLAEAQHQALISRVIGEVKTSQYSGSVEMKEKAGTEEAQLLAARAVKECAAKVASAVQDRAEKFYIFGATEFPNFQRLLSFRFRKELITQAFKAAGISQDAALDAVALPALASAGIEAASKLLGFFQSDYTVGGIDAALNESLLLFSVAGRLSKKEVHLPSIYEPAALDPTVMALMRQLTDLVELRTIAMAEVSKIKEEIARAEKEAAKKKEGDPQETEKEETDSENAATEDETQENASSKNPRLDQLNAVIALYDAFATSLTTPDANGNVPLSAIALEFAIDGALKANAAVLLLRLENSGGGYLIKKNLWTALGGMPLFHMGGATVSYLLLKGQTGRVLAADTIPVYGGYVKTNELRTELGGLMEEPNEDLTLRNGDAD